MDVWTHPASAALRDAADEALAAASAALRARRAERKNWGRPGGRGSPGDSPQQSPSTSSPRLRRAAQKGALLKHGSPRSSPLGAKGSRRTPSPADFELGPAATATATAHLQKLDVRALQKKARAVGCDTEELAKVAAGVRSFGRDSDAGSLGYSPKHALIDLIQAKTNTPRRRSAAKELPTTSSLHKMGVRALRQRARDLGVDEEQLTEVVEGSSPKRGLISLIEATASATSLPELQLEALAEPEPQPQPETEPDPQPLAEPASSPPSPANQWQAWQHAPVEQPTAEDRRLRLEALPPQLLAALQAVENVDVDSSSHLNRSSNCTKQLRQLKQTYAADLVAALGQVEAALASVKAMSHIASQDTADGGMPSQQIPSSRPLSMLETMAGELLGDRVLPALAAVDLARLGQSCRTLQVLVRSRELEGVWKSHYRGRWGSDYSSPGTESTPALDYSHRANVEQAWRSTCWVDMRMPHGLCARSSTVETSAVLLQGPQHEVCAVGFDRERQNAATGDMDGVVRIWDIAQSLRGAKEHQNSNEIDHDGKFTPRTHGRRSVGSDSGLGRNARLAVMRLHKKGHAVRWMTMHGRRLLCSCASAMHNINGSGGDRSGAVVPGRLVLVDLDDLERQQNNSMLTKGVAAAAVDTSCGFIGTGLHGEHVCGGHSVPNGFPVDTAWVGVGGAITRFDLGLDQAERLPAPAPLPPVSSVVITTHYEDTVNAAVPLLGLGGLGYQTAAVATAAGVVCTVDLDDSEETPVNNGVGDHHRAQRILRRWPAPTSPDGSLRLGHSALAAVQSISTLVATWYPHEAMLLTDRQFGTLRVLDPRQEKPTVRCSFRLLGLIKYTLRCLQLYCTDLMSCDKQLIPHVG